MDWNTHPTPLACSKDHNSFSVLPWPIGGRDTGTPDSCRYNMEETYLLGLADHVHQWLWGRLVASLHHGQEEAGLMGPAIS